MSKRKVNEDDMLDATIQLAKFGSFSTTQSLTNMVMSALLALAPAYLFIKVKDMPPMESSLPYFGAGIVACIYFMTQAYHKTATARYNTIHERNRVASTSLDHEKKVAQLYRNEAAQYALFRNNGIFVVSFLFLAFYVLRAVQVEWAYAASVSGASVLVYLL